MSGRGKVGLFGLVILVIVLFDVAVHLGAAVTPTGHDYPWHPITLVADLVRERSWPPAATYFVVGVAAIAFVLLLAMILSQTGGQNVDTQQRHLLAGNTISGLLEKRRRRDAAQLHPAAINLSPGHRLGRLVGSRRQVLQGWRELGVFIFGPGRGKTSAYVIRHLLEAPGPAIMTTNKVDGVQQVLAGRKDQGTAWVFDPQRIVRPGARPDFVFDPLSVVHDMTDAHQLASIFEAATKDVNSRSDSQFDSQGRDLLAYALYAAALDRAPLAIVFDWLTGMKGEDVRDILIRHGKVGPAAALLGLSEQPDKTRGSVYATAQRMASPLANDALIAWTGTTGVRVFDPARFVDSTDTLILLSKEGPGSGDALLTALIRAVCQAAERRAQSVGGRLPVPITAELDECANIVRWPELPALYSFYGSLGIILNTYFQSWAQGVGVFGRDGMQALWNAASIRVYGGGEGDTEFLARLSKTIGEYDEQVTNSSSGNGGHHSTSTSTRRRPILSVDDLANLPEWRVVIDSSAARPVLVESTPWFRDKTLRAQINGTAKTTAPTAATRVAVTASGESSASV